MLTFDQYRYYNLVESASFISDDDEQFVEALGDWAKRAANWVGNKMQAAGTALQTKAGDPNSMLNPVGFQNKMQAAGQAIQRGANQFVQNPVGTTGKALTRIGSALSGQSAGPQTGSLPQTIKILNDLHRNLDNLTNTARNTGNSEMAQNYMDIYRLVGQALSKANALMSNQKTSN